MTTFIHFLTCIFGWCVLLALIVSGFTMMCLPAAGRQMLKNTFVAIAMFVVASMLLQAACGALVERTHGGVVIRNGW